MRRTQILCAALALAWALGPVASAAGPTATHPQFDNRDHWPADVGKCAYTEEIWAEARLLVWRDPANSGRKRGDGWEAERWMEYPSAAAYAAGAEGKPATKPPDENTDVLLPAAERNYKVFMREGKVRHATIERNAQLRMFHGTVTGNVWVKDGGRMEVDVIKGTKDTFFRSKNEEPNHLGGDLAHVKGKNASTEFIGNFMLADRLFVKAGRMILSPGSLFMPAGERQHRTPIYPGSTLALLSGATFCKTSNMMLNLDISLGGTLMAGLPERPLTEDCYVGLSYKLKDLGSGNTASFATKDRMDDRGMVVLKTGKIEVHSTDPSKARLVIHWQGKPNEKHDKALRKAGRPVHRIEMVILPDLELNGVMFDHFKKGGIELANPKMRSKWKHIYFGEHNEGEPEELFAPHEGNRGYRL